MPYIGGSPEVRMRSAQPGWVISDEVRLKLRIPEAIANRASGDDRMYEGQVRPVPDLLREKWTERR
jgi:hypothetical protein